MFANRIAAGRQLAEKLDQFFLGRPDLKRSDVIVVGLPRGGVPVALEIARKFHCPLEILVSKKLPFPGQPEYAIGAVSSDGVVVLNPDIPQESQWEAYIEQQRQQLIPKTITIENQFYELAGLKRSSFADKTVIIVDDGIATGMTAVAAIETARQRGAKHIIIAAPVISSESYNELRSRCWVVAITVPTDFMAVGHHYRDFDQTSNEEVVIALREGAKIAPSGGPQQRTSTSIPPSM